MLSSCSCPKVVVAGSLHMRELKGLKSVGSKISCLGSLGFKGKSSLFFFFSVRFYSFYIISVLQLSSHLMLWFTFCSFERPAIPWWDWEYDSLIYAWNATNFGNASRIISVKILIKDLLLWGSFAKSAYVFNWLYLFVIGEMSPFSEWKKWNTRILLCLERSSNLWRSTELQ